MKAIVLAGGSGERFWPLSTPEKPKQFLNVFGGESLISRSVERLRGIVDAADVYVITAAALVHVTKKELPNLPRKNIVGEPMRRDTGAAVALGVALAGKGERDELLAFLPSDQLVVDVKAFRKSLRAAAKLAQSRDVIVTLGVPPRYPATGFGYVDPKSGAFVEKPDLRKAKAYLRKGYLWNAGMFIARASVFADAISTCAGGLKDLLGLRSLSGLGKVYAGLPRISFDYAVMEKLSQTGRVAVVPCDCGWDDVGSYAAFERHFPCDRDGNVFVGEVNAAESAGCTAVAKGAKIALLGVKDLVVVTTKDAVLVVAKDKVAELKKLFAK